MEFSSIKENNMLSKNAQKVADDQSFKATKHSRKEFAILSSNSNRLGMTVSDLQIAGQELVDAGVAENCPSGSIKKV